MKKLLTTLLFATMMAISYHASAATVDLTLNDAPFGVYLGNDSVASLEADAGILGAVELHRTPDAISYVTSGSSYMLENQEILVIKYNGVYGVYDLTPTGAVEGDLLQWETADFSNACWELTNQGGKAPNCNAAVSHITSYSGDVPEVPIPAAVWLFGSGLLGLVGVARRKKA